MTAVVITTTERVINVIIDDDSFNCKNTIIDQKIDYYYIINFIVRVASVTIMATLKLVTKDCSRIKTSINVAIKYHFFAQVINCQIQLFLQILINSLLLYFIIIIVGVIAIIIVKNVAVIIKDAFEKDIADQASTVDQEEYIKQDHSTLLVIMFITSYKNFMDFK